MRSLLCRVVVQHDQEQLPYGEEREERVWYTPSKESSWEMSIDADSNTMILTVAMVCYCCQQWCYDSDVSMILMSAVVLMLMLAVTSCCCYWQWCHDTKAVVLILAMMLWCQQQFCDATMLTMMLIPVLMPWHWHWCHFINTLMQIQAVMLATIPMPAAML